MYFLTAFIAFLFSIITWGYNKKSRFVSFCLSLFFLWLVGFEGLRWQVGTDWYSYYNYFQLPEDYLGFEPGYKYLNILFRKYTNNYSYFLVFLAAFCYYFIFKTLRELSDKPMMAVTVFYGMMAAFVGMNRQYFAFAICIFAIKYIIRRDLVKFLLSIFLALLFHRTAIFFFPSYFMFGLRLSFRKILVGVVLLLPFYLFSLLNKIPYVEYFAFLGSDFTYRIQTYQDSNLNFSAVFGIVKRLFFICIFYKYIILKHKNSVSNLLFNFYVFGTAIYFITNGTILQSVASRGALYYNIYECILLPSVIIALPLKNDLKQILWSLVFVYYLFMMNRDMNSIIPVAGYDVFNPYRSILIN